ncbi:MAG TPA: hypothetical protein VFB21_09640 [Chthonomonadaceae bacterium]|nr:hypothetical protein [Chthonomonadaceae bacterium]
MVPVNDVQFAVRTGRAPSRVVLVPSGQELPFQQEGAYCHITVPSVVTSQLVALEGV